MHFVYKEITLTKKQKIVVFVLVCSLFIGFFFYFEHISKQPTYSFYGEKVPSIYAAVGKRSIIGGAGALYDSSIDGYGYKNHKYKSKTPAKDLRAYKTLLIKEGGFVDVSTEYTGWDTYLKKASPTSEYYIVIRLQFDGKGYRIWMMRER